MKILTLILSILGGLVALVLIIASFLPKTFQLSAEVVVDKPSNEVRNYAKILANQKNYSVRVMTDPNVQLIYEGIDGTVWAKQARDSTMKNVGKGEQEITKIDEWKSYEVVIRFEKPMKATNYSRTTIESVGENKTKVTNTFRGVNPRPGNFVSMFFLPQVRKDMQQNMNNLKVQLEK